MIERRPVPDGLAQLGSPYWSEGRARAMLGPALNDALVLTTADGSRVTPVAQFRKTNAGTELRPGLREFFRAVAACDPWTVLTYLYVPQMVQWQGEALSVMEAARRGADGAVLGPVGERLARDLSR